MSVELERASTLYIAVVTLFPEMFEAITEFGITGRAVSNQLVSLRCINPREFTSDRHQTVDDRPYGGGPGMVMRIEPLKAAIDAARDWIASKDDSVPATVIYLSPQGKKLDQTAVNRMVDAGNLILIAGRYEGIDERLIEAEVDVELSIGDYVLSGGELPAMVLLDAMIRQLPGALGASESAQQDSFMRGLLDCPHYTRPEQYESVEVPSVLLSGNHKKIEQWRLQQALGRTWERRPDLLQNTQLDAESEALLSAYIKERSTDQ